MFEGKKLFFYLLSSPLDWFGSQFFEREIDDHLSGSCIILNIKNPLDVLKIALANSAR